MLRQLTFFIIILQLPFSLITHAQENDTLVFLEDLTFSSTFEEKVFHEYFKENKQDYLALFVASDENVKEEDYNSYKKIFEANLAEIDRDKLNNKNEKKKIKFIYDDIHDRFLKKYELQNKFSNIFSRGYYNCVSGSALYAMVFDKFDIPYIVKEKPTHVYLMSFPETGRILVEPTDPNSGYLVFNSIYKTTFIENLKTSKIIGSEEAKSGTVDELFDKYYFFDENITIKELVGIQYTNDALYRLEQKDFTGALFQLEKAYLFYPSEKVASLLFMLNAEILSSSQYEDLSYASHLAKLSRYGQFGITNQNIEGEFARANNILLIDKNDKEGYRNFYETVISQLQDSALITDISFIYNYENGRVAYNQAKYEESLPYLKKAFDLKPQNHDIGNLFVAAISNTVRYQSDTKVALETLEKFKEEHPGLIENNNFKSMLVTAYLLQAYYSFDLNKPTEGNRFRELFRQHYSTELTVDITLIGRAYSNAAVYYFRKGNKSKANVLLNEGLELAPNNHELLMRKRMIN